MSPIYVELTHVLCFKKKCLQANIWKDDNEYQWWNELIGPWEILMKSLISNFQANISNEFAVTYR